MYEQVSHSLLNDILNQIRPEISKQDLRHFYTRLGANFYAIHSLFVKLYGDRDDFDLVGLDRISDTDPVAGFGQLFDIPVHFLA